jgi:hypothetical protein
MVIECFGFMLLYIGIVIYLSSLTNAIWPVYAVLAMHEALFRTETLLCVYL